MKKIVLILLTLFISNFTNAQSLTIEETLEYLNKILLDHRSGDYYQSIKLDEDGKIIFKHFNSNYIEEIDLINGKLDEITAGNYVAEPYVRVRLKYYGIQRVKIKENKKENRKWFDIHIKNIDINTNKKFTNALKYLASLIISSEKYNEIDDDPFASNNFNPYAFEIIGEKDNDEVKLTKKGGVYYIDISIGGIIESFIFDTGASNVLISKNLERKLISKGVLKKENYIQDGLYRIADGSIIRLRRLLIPKLKIGNFTLSNVQASVTNSTTLLLGKSVLDKFKNWKINNLTETLELNK